MDYNRYIRFNVAELEDITNRLNLLTDTLEPQEALFIKQGVCKLFEEFDHQMKSIEGELNTTQMRADNAEALALQLLDEKARLEKRVDQLEKIFNAAIEEKDKRKRKEHEAKKPILKKS